MAENEVKNIQINGRTYSVADEKARKRIDEQNKNLGGLRFGVDGDGNYGYYKADDSFIPFSNSVFVGVESVGLNRSGDAAGSIYLGCAIEENAINTCKYVKWQIRNSIEQYVYTSKGSRTPTSLGNGTWEYECASDEKFVIGTYNNTIMGRNVGNTEMRMLTCKFLPKKPTT